MNMLEFLACRKKREGEINRDRETAIFILYRELILDCNQIINISKFSFLFPCPRWDPYTVDKGVLPACKD